MAALMTAGVVMVIGSTVVVKMDVGEEKAVEAAAMQIESQRTIRLGLQLLLLQSKRPLTLDLNNLQIVLLHLVWQLERPINIMCV